MLRVFTIAIALLVGCASMSGNFPIKPTLQQETNRRLYRPRPCIKTLTARAYQELLKGEGSPEGALYYFRCRETPDFVLELRKLRTRRSQLWQN